MAGRLADDLFGAVVFSRIQEVDAKVDGRAYDFDALLSAGTTAKPDGAVATAT